MITRTPEKEIFQATGITIREVMHQVSSHNVLMKAEMKEPPVISTGKKKRKHKQDEQEEQNKVSMCTAKPKGKRGKKWGGRTSRDYTFKNRNPTTKRNKAIIITKSEM